MDHHFRKHQQTKSGSYFFEVTVGPQAETFENHVKKVFAGFGLKSNFSIKAFDNFMGGQSFFREMVESAKNNPAVADAVRNPKGKTTKINVIVQPSIVEKLRQFGINLAVNHQGKATFTGHNATFGGNVKKYQNFTLAPETPISQWTPIQKLDSVIRRTALLLPEEVGRQLLGLLEPRSLAIMVAVLIMWIGGHFFVASEIVDVGLLLFGTLFLGFAAFQAGGLLANFAIKCFDGRTEKDLDESAQNLADAIALIGIQVVMALLLAKAPNVFREPKMNMNQLEPSVPLTMETVGEPPTTPGKLFYEPKLTEKLSDFPHGPSGGSTDRWGDITLLVTKNIKDVNAVKVHELVHRFLIPKLQIFPKLRQFSAVLKNQGYLRSNILRYLEEALAETFAQLKVNGINWRNFMAGVRFPVGMAGESCYVTNAAMATEAEGILIRSITVGGMIFNVYYKPAK